MGFFEETDRTQEIGSYKRLLKTIGKAALNSLYPNDFEYYMCALELTDSNDSTIEVFIFPIMPDSISESNNSNINIKKTFGGIVSLSSDDFILVDISIKGNFGRKFKFLLGRTDVDAVAFNFNNKKNEGTASFSNQIKTGFGCLKILEKIYKLSNSTDIKGNPYRLYFYNMALGNHYLVKIINYTPDMSMDSNMVWRYNLSMKGIAPIIGRKKELKTSLKSMLKKSILSKTINTVSKTLSNELKLAIYK